MAVSLPRLTEDQQQILALRFWDGFTVEESATRTGKSVTAEIASRSALLARARELKPSGRSRGSSSAVAPGWLARLGALLSAGLVVPNMLEALEAAGYDRSFELLSLSPQAAHLAPVVLPDWTDILDLRCQFAVPVDLSGVVGRRETPNATRALIKSERGRLGGRPLSQRAG